MHRDWINIGGVMLRRERLTFDKAKKYDKSLTEDKFNELLQIKKKKIVIPVVKEEKKSKTKHKSKFDK